MKDLRTVCAAIVLCVAPMAGAADYLSPSAMVASPDGKAIYVALYDGTQVAVFDVASGKVTRTIAVRSNPTGVAI